MSHNPIQHATAQRIEAERKSTEISAREKALRKIREENAGMTMRIQRIIDGKEKSKGANEHD